MNLRILSGNFGVFARFQPGGANTRDAIPVPWDKMEFVGWSGGGAAEPKEMA